MDTTFITIHDLSPEATILYSSDSIVDILGHTPDEVVNRSCWDFFHPQEVPLAKKMHGRGLKLDKAAVLAYCSIKNRQGQWVCCECCFTVVFDVMVGCTSIYRQGLKSQKRAVEAPIVRRLFSSSPRDPRYHMLSHLSGKFVQTPDQHTEHEPRAALFLNRFTRTLTVMYATDGLEQIIGISGEEMKGLSFYYCIAENCLQEAVNCLESAKGNDSIAYLRFFFRDPRQDDYHPDALGDSDDEMTEVTTDDELDEDSLASEQGDLEQGRSLSGSSDFSQPSSTYGDMDLDGTAAQNSGSSSNIQARGAHEESRASSGNSMKPSETHAAIFGQEPPKSSSASSMPTEGPVESGGSSREPIELEAVVSCTSDGLVVCLRRARPVIPHPLHRPAQPTYSQGLFAAPWAAKPVMPTLDSQPFNANSPFASTSSPSSAPSSREPARSELVNRPAAIPMGPNLPQPQRAAAAPHQSLAQSMPARCGGPAQEDFMASIRETAIFAWALTGINGSLAAFGKGNPTGESQPPDGFPPHNSDQRPPQQPQQAPRPAVDSSASINGRTFFDPIQAANGTNNYNTQDTKPSAPPSHSIN